MREYIAVIEGMVEGDDATELTASGFQIETDEIQTYFASWYIATVARYTVVTFERTFVGDCLHTLAKNEDREVVAYLILSGVDEDVQRVHVL